MGDELIGGRYRRLEEIGVGGMARVFRARDVRLERDVAIKIVTEQPGDDSRLFYFHREARAIATLQHQNIVPIFDYSGPDESPAYIVMALVEAGDLENALDGRDLPPELFISSVGQSVGCALEHAHGRGVVHRDLKLSNILIEESGRLLLTDFGLAKGYADQSILGKTAVRETTTLFGTPNYMAPEQLRGKAPGPPSDIFSLGVILYYLSVGELPFDSPSPATVMQSIIDGVYPPLHPSPDADRSGRLVGLIERCLATEPELRPTATDVVVEFEEALANSNAHKVEANIRYFLGLSGSQPIPRSEPEAGKRRKSAKEDLPGGRRRRSSGSRRRKSKSQGRRNDPIKLKAASLQARRASGKSLKSPETLAAKDDTVVSPPFIDQEETLSDNFMGAGADTIDERFLGPEEETALLEPTPAEAVKEPPISETAIEPIPSSIASEATLVVDDAGGRAPPRSPGWAKALLVVSALAFLLAIAGYALVRGGVVALPDELASVLSKQRGAVDPTPVEIEVSEPTTVASPAGTTGEEPPDARDTGTWEEAIEGVVARAEAAEGASTKDGQTATGDERNNRDPGTDSGAKGNNRSPDAKRRKRDQRDRERQGTLHVVARPWGSIMINGTKKGNTPLVSKIKLAPGVHTVVASHPDYKHQMQKVKIVVGQTTKIVFDFRD